MMQRRSPNPSSPVSSHRGSPFSRKRRRKKVSPKRALRAAPQSLMSLHHSKSFNKRLAPYSPSAPCNPSRQMFPKVHQKTKSSSRGTLRKNWEKRKNLRQTLPWNEPNMLQRSKSSRIARNILRAYQPTIDIPSIRKHKKLKALYGLMDFRVAHSGSRKGLRNRRPTTVIGRTRDPGRNKVTRFGRKTEKHHQYSSLRIGSFLRSESQSSPGLPYVPSLRTSKSTMVLNIYGAPRRPSLSKNQSRSMKDLNTKERSGAKFALDLSGLDFGGKDGYKKRVLMGFQKVDSSAYELSANGEGYKQEEFALNSKGMALNKSVRSSSLQNSASSASLRLWKDEQGLCKNPPMLNLSKLSLQGKDNLEDDIVTFTLDADDFTNVAVLGRGSCGVVYKSWHWTSQRFVALKAISVLEEEKRRQVMKELRMYTMSKHNKGIVDFYGAFYKEGQICMALEFMDRGSLADILEHESKSSKDINEIAYVAKQVVLGLAFMHKNKKLHRDIKPGNLLANSQGEVKLTDFGIIADFMNRECEQCRTVVGTAVFMSPERLNAKDYSFPSDIWSLGLTLVNIALGKLPINASGGPWAIMNAIMADKTVLIDSLDLELFPSDFIDFAAGCLHLEPKQRSTIDQLLSHDFLKRSEITKSVTFLKDPRPTDFSRAREEVHLIVDLAIKKRQEISKRTPESVTAIALHTGLSETSVRKMYQDRIAGIRKTNRWPRKKGDSLRDIPMF